MNKVIYTNQLNSMKVKIKHEDGSFEHREVKKFVHPYPIGQEVKDELVRVQKSKEPMTIGKFTFEGVSYPIVKVIINGFPTWFIEGHSMMTVFEYEPTRITIQVKMFGGGEWCVEGERRRPYQSFVYNLVEMLGGGNMPVFNDRTDNYTNVLGSVDCNGVHPFKLVV